MALEADKRNLLIFFSVVGCILIGTQVFSYSRLTKKAGSLRETLTGTQLALTFAAGHLISTSVHATLHT